MATALQLGDRVINLQVPGVFIVVGRRGVLIDIETEQGLRMTVLESGLRRLDGPPPVPRDEE